MSRTRLGRSGTHLAQNGPSPLAPVSRGRAVERKKGLLQKIQIFTSAAVSTPISETIKGAARTWLPSSLSDLWDSERLGYKNMLERDSYKSSHLPEGKKRQYLVLMDTLVLETTAEERKI